MTTTLDETIKELREVYSIIDAAYITLERKDFDALLDAAEKAAHLEQRVKVLEHFIERTGMICNDPKAPPYIKVQIIKGVVHDAKGHSGRDALAGGKEGV